MQDRFKFRVWSYEQKKMYNWSDCIKITNFIYGMFVDNRMLGRGSWNIEQCTGLKDKNGKLIYEGDILGGLYGSPIAWCDTCKSFCLSCFGECMTCSGDVMWAEIVEDDGELEVIGNIHINADLLE